MTSPALTEKPIRTPIWVTWLLHAAIGIVFLVMILQINRRITGKHSGDFRHFYFAAGALLDHRDLYGPVPMDVELKALGRQPTPDEIDWYIGNTDRYLYPPLIAMLYTPLARLRFDHAQRIMLIVNSLLVWAGILLIARSFVRRFALPADSVVIAFIALMGLLVNEDKIHADLQMFQTNALMFFMFALSLTWLDCRPTLAGLPLGVIMNIKYLSLPMLPWLLLRRRWGTAMGCIASSLLFAFLPAIISGWSTNLHNLTVAYGGLAHMLGKQDTAEQANVDDIRDYLSCSITSAMARTQNVPVLVTLHPKLLAAHGVTVDQVLASLAPYKTTPGPVRVVDGGENLQFDLGTSRIGTGVLREVIVAVENGKQIALAEVADVRYEQGHLLRPMLYTAGIAAVLVFITLWFYWSAGVPAFLWPALPRQTAQPWRSVIGVEFASIIAVTLCFSPQTNTRHLMLATFITLALSALLVCTRSWMSRCLIVLAGAAIAIGFTWPPGGQDSHNREMFWFGIGGQCWCLLLAVMVMIFVGVTRANSPLLAAARRAELGPAGRR
jgi:hypothetical protein